jgi:two-component system nitrogen regulation response regulator GlnG
MKTTSLEALSLSNLISERLELFFQSHATSLPLNLHAVILEQVERPLIKQTLQITNGNQIKAADILGVNRNTLRKKIKLFKIDLAHYK